MGSQKRGGFLKYSSVAFLYVFMFIFINLVFLFFSEYFNKLLSTIQSNFSNTSLSIILSLVISIIIFGLLISIFTKILKIPDIIDSFRNLVKAFKGRCLIKRFKRDNAKLKHEKAKD